MQKSPLAILGIGLLLLLAGFGRSVIETKTQAYTPSPDKIPLSPDVGHYINSPAVPFGGDVTMSFNSKLNFNDGLELKLISSTDTRCPKDAKCADPGELTLRAVLTGGTIGETPREVTLSTVRARLARVDGYTVYLQDVTATTAKFTVSKEASKK